MKFTVSRSLSDKFHRNYNEFVIFPVHVPTFNVHVPTFYILMPKPSAFSILAHTASDNVILESSN